MLLLAAGDASAAPVRHLLSYYLPSGPPQSPSSLTVSTEPILRPAATQHEVASAGPTAQHPYPRPAGRADGYI
jgi:hypothetical protein